MSVQSSIRGASREILSALPDMFVLYDSDSTVLDILHPVTDLASTVLSLPVGSKLCDSCSKMPPDQYVARFNGFCETGCSEQFLYGCQTDAGRMRHYEVAFSALKSGNILAVIRAVSEDTVMRIEAGHLYRYLVDILDTVAIPVWVESLDTGRYVYWNKKAEIFGFGADGTIASTEERFVSAGHACADRKIERQWNSSEKKTSQGIDKIVLNDGKEHTFFMTRSLFSLGGERMVLASALDISDLTETRASLLRTKNELARKNMTLYSVLSLAQVIPWECDLRQQVFSCDYRAYHHESATQPDEQGRYVIPMERYFAGIHPDYRADAISRIEELASGKQCEFHETYLVHWFNDREWDWVRVQCCVSERDAAGRPVLLFGSAQRVTEQKRMELALRQAKEKLSLRNAMLTSVLNMAEVVPWICDRERGIFYCNYENYHHEQAQGPDSEGYYVVPIAEYFDRIRSDYRNRIIELFHDVSTGRIGEFHEIYPVHWYNDRDYEWVEIQCNASPRDTEGMLRHLTGSARIATAQMNTELTLRREKEKAELSNMLKSTFMANMSHEIRTPLNAIVGFSELLSQTEDPDEKGEYFGIIQNNNALLLQLIGDILDLSKIEAGTLDFVMTDVNLDELMDELEQVSRRKVADRLIEVTCIERIPGCTIRTDRNRLLQVLHNFVNNAVKFTRRGFIRFGFRQQDDGCWYFYVEDSGCGICAEKLDSVFGRFVKLNNTAQGTGLGLAISKSIIEQFHGKIGVDSVEGQGSTFWFILPPESVRITGGKSEKAQLQPEKTPDERGSEGEITLLIAEDNPGNYKFLECVLQKEYKLLHARDGREAVALCDACRPDLILMDIKMPEMDGFQAVSAIRKTGSDVPIVAVTAFAFPEDERKILSAGFDGCLIKPVSTKKLKRTVFDFLQDRNRKR